MSLRVFRRNLQQGLVRLRGVLEVRKLLQPTLGGLAIQGLLLLDVGGDLGELRFVREQITPTTELAVQRDQLAHLDNVVLVELVVELNDLVQHADQCSVALDVLSIDGGNLAKNRETLLVVLGVRPLQLLTQ